ncbi:hypothetical protein D3C74_276250 [compost metagenome]
MDFDVGLEPGLHIQERVERPAGGLDFSTGPGFNVGNVAAAPGMTMQIAFRYAFQFIQRVKV